MHDAQLEESEVISREKEICFLHQFPLGIFPQFFEYGQNNFGPFQLIDTFSHAHKKMSNGDRRCTSSVDVFNITCCLPLSCKQDDETMVNINKPRPKYPVTRVHVKRKDVLSFPLIILGCFVMFVLLTTIPSSSNHAADSSHQRQGVSSLWRKEEAMSHRTFMGGRTGSGMPPKDDGQEQQDEHNDEMVQNSLSKVVNAPPEAVELSNPFYLQGKVRFQYERFHDVRTYRRLEREQSISHVQVNHSTWILPDRLMHPTRNHDSVLLEYGGKHILVNILGRSSRYVQVMDLHTGEQWDHITNATDPAEFPLNDLNHVYTVMVDLVHDSTKKEVWLPCGFKGDRVNREKSIKYARILDLETLVIRTGPKLPFSGGACVAQALRIIPDEPPMICTFGGTIGRHDSGGFVPYSACFDRVREKFWFPFGKLPLAFDHGSISFVPKSTCHAGDPARLVILNFRTESYGTQRSEMMGYDMPDNGWTLEHLEKLTMEDAGSWYFFANISYTGPEDVANCPRDASGTVVLNGGRNILNFGGIFYDFPNGEFRSTKFSTIRSFDVCDKEWTVVGDLGLQVFALQTCASQDLQLCITCGGEARRLSKTSNNNPWCVVTRLHAKSVVQNRHGLPALTNIADDFLPGAHLRTGAGLSSLDTA
jgi:hypothetical protein